jgi:lysophospholipase L1-like esterase
MRHTIYSALIFVAACGAALLLGEGVLRWVAPDGYYVWPPNYSMTFAPTMPGLRGESRFVINESGIRGRAFSEADRYRILAVGGSTTECLYLDETEAWPHLLEQQLSAESRVSPVWVGNVGKSGHNSEHHVLQVEKLLDQYPHIDLVLVLVGTNDMTKVGSDGRYSPLNDVERQLAFAVHPAGLNQADAGLPFFKRTELWRTLRKVRDNLVASFDGALVQDTLGAVYVRMRENRRNATALIDDYPDLSVALHAYKSNLNRIVDAAEAHGTEVVFATQPSLWSENMTGAAQDLLWMGRIGKYYEDAPAAYHTARALAGGMKAFNDVLLDVCEERSLDCVDLAAAVPKTPEAFYDDVHFTEAGARIVADVLARHLIDGRGTKISQR